MDITNANVEPIIEHAGTCRTFFLVPMESMRSQTEGSYLEFVCEFEIEAGSRLDPHRHNTHEYYYVLSGRAMMQIENEKREVKPGDLIHIPPNAVHSIAPLGDEPVRSLAFAASFLPPGGAGLDAERAELPS
jgi:quercetin dioxygenase-like cupin family protein